jgi:hypothetical protein
MIHQTKIVAPREKFLLDKAGDKFSDVSYVRRYKDRRTSSMASSETLMK